MSLAKKIKVGLALKKRNHYKLSATTKSNNIALSSPSVSIIAALHGLGANWTHHRLSLMSLIQVQSNGAEMDSPKSPLPCPSVGAGYWLGPLQGLSAGAPTRGLSM